MWIDDNRLPNQNLLLATQRGPRKGGGQKRFNDVLKQNIKKCNIDSRNPVRWTGISGDLWRRNNNLRIQTINRTGRKKKKRRQKERQQWRPNPLSKTACPQCWRSFQANFSLISHIWVHKPNWLRQTKQDHHTRPRGIATTSKFWQIRNIHMNTCSGRWNLELNSFIHKYSCLLTSLFTDDEPCVKRC